MGHQIIRQPGKRVNYAIFSTGTDRWIAHGLDWSEVIEFYEERAAEKAREDTNRILQQVNEDPHLAYYQFAMTFEEANAASVEHGGEDLGGKLSVQEAVANADVHPGRLSADLTMADGRTVHVPVVPPAGPASAGRIKVAIPYPEDAVPGLVISAAVTNEDLGVIFRSGFPYTHTEPGDTLTVEFGEESLDAEALAKILGVWP